MRDTSKETIRLRLRFEFAIEVILKGIIFILFGLAFLFASNLLTFNWPSVILVLLGFMLYYLKISSYLEIVNDRVTVQYMKFIHKRTIELKQVTQIVFFDDSLLVEIHSQNQKNVSFYLNRKKREILLNYILHNYPEIPCLFYDKTD